MTNKMENINDVIMEKNYTVYMHVSPNGKVYIGITKNKPKKRWSNGYGYKNNEYFWRAIQKYEWDNFKHIIIENNLSKKQAENMEIELIAKYRSNESDYGYNIESGGNVIGKTSNETKKKMSENSKNSKKIHCDNLIFNSITECANYYSMKLITISAWLRGNNKMNKDFQQLNLRYATENDLNECEKYNSNKHGDKANIIIAINDGSSKFIHCDNLIFNSITECAKYYNISRCTMENWLLGNNKMNKDFQKLNLRYATENDLNECEKYDIKKHGDKASIDITINEYKGKKKVIHCDGLIFNSITDCAKYYNLNVATMRNWINDKRTMNEDFQKLNLHYATENNLNECEKYDINKHGDKASIVINKGSSKFIHCDNLIFNSITECAKYYNISRCTMKNWLNGKRTMNEDFQKLNLRYATNEDLNTYPRYTPVNN